MMIDIRTLILFTVISFLIQFLVLFTQYNVNREIKGIRWWILWSIVESIGCSLLLFRDNQALLPVIICIQNPLLLSGVVFIYIGLFRFFKKNINLNFIFSFFAGYVGLHLFFYFIHDSINIRFLLFSSSMAFLGFLCAFSIHKSKFYLVNSTVKFNIILFLVHGFIFSIQSIKFLLGNPVTDMFAQTVFNFTQYFEAPIISLLWTFGFIMMINQKLHVGLLESKSHFEQIFTTSPDAVCITRIDDGVIVDCNEGYEKLSGYSKKDLLGKSTIGLNVWTDIKDREEVVRLIKEQGYCQNYEAVFQKKDGSHIAGSMSAKVVTLQGIPHLISVTHDISERQRAEKKIRENQEKFHLAFDNANIGMCLVDLEGNLFKVNNLMCKIFGYTKEELESMTTNDIAHPDYSHVSPTFIRRAQKGEMDHTEFEKKYIHKNGNLIIAHVSSSLVRSAKGDPMYFISHVIDITERKEIEKALFDSEKKLFSILENVDAYIYLKDLNGHYLFANRPVRELFGKTMEDIIGKGDEYFFDPETASQLRLNDRQVLIEGKTLRSEENNLNVKDGLISTFLSVKLPLRNESGEIYALCGISTDISERKRAEEALTEANQKLEENAKELFSLATSDGLTKVANRRRFDEYLSIEWQRHIRSKEPLALILIDIDFFKDYNDYYGHQSGDNCLVIVTEAITKLAKRPGDLVARYGGEEFAVILTNTNLEGGFLLASTMRKEVEDLKIPHASSKVGSFITLSIGVSSIIPTLATKIDSLVAHADSALYEAKKKGRNQVVKYLF